MRKKHKVREEEAAVRTAEVNAAAALLAAVQAMAEETARVNVELRRCNELILDASAEGIFGLDMRGHVTFINRAATRMLGWTYEELAGTSLHDLMHATHDGATPVHCALCNPDVTAPRPRPAELRTRCGQTIAVELKSSLLRDLGGTPTGVVVTFCDMSERRAIERMKDEFVSTVGHELRTPLTSIRGALGLLGAGILGTVNEKAQRMLDISISNTDRLIRLVNDILDVERLASGRIEVRRVRVNIADLMREAIDVMQPQADHCDIRLAIDAAHAEVFVDRDRMMQTLTNLLRNAVTFSPRGTTIWCTTELSETNLLLRVADQGHGIAPDNQELVFERFRQADGSDSRAHGGSGLGLPICRSIIEAHGGRLSVESELGKGSTFIIELPLPPALDEAVAV